MPTPDDRCAPPSPTAPEPTGLAVAPLPRRSFLGLAAGASTAWLVGCGDDLPTGEGDGSGSSSGAASGSSDTTEQGGSTSGSSGSADGADSTTGDTGEPEACLDDAVLEAFEPDAIPQDDAAFPFALMAGEMRTTSALLAIQIPDAEPKLLRVWRTADEPGMVWLVLEVEVVPTADGYAKLPIEGLCPGTWYRYAYFVGEPGSLTARSLVAEFRTTPADDVLEPLTVAITACNGSSLDWPALDRTAEEDYDVFIHLGDMAYNDGAFTLAEYRQSWRAYLGVAGYHFKIIMNSVPITNMPGVWDVAAFDRWEGFPAQRDALLAFIDENLITNVWFLSGGFHTCFVARIEERGGLSANTWEIAVTGGNSNPLPQGLTGFDGPPFDYGVTVPRGCILRFDPAANTVHVRFIDPDSGQDDYDALLSQAPLDG